MYDPMILERAEYQANLTCLSGWEKLPIPLVSICRSLISTSPMCSVLRGESSSIGITESCKMSCECRKSNLGPLEEHLGVSATESSL